MHIAEMMKTRARPFLGGELSAELTERGYACRYSKSSHLRPRVMPLNFKIPFSSPAITRPRPEGRDADQGASRELGKARWAEFFFACALQGIGLHWKKEKYGRACPPQAASIRPSPLPLSEQSPEGAGEDGGAEGGDAGFHGFRCGF